MDFIDEKVRCEQQPDSASCALSRFRQELEPRNYVASSAAPLRETGSPGTLPPFELSAERTDAPQSTLDTDIKRIGGPTEIGRSLDPDGCMIIPMEGGGAIVMTPNETCTVTPSPPWKFWKK